MIGEDAGVCAGTPGSQRTTHMAILCSAVTSVELGVILYEDLRRHQASASGPDPEPAPTADNVQLSEQAVCQKVSDQYSMGCYS